MSNKEQQPDQEFWDLADAFIDLANAQSEKARNTKVSAAMLYAASRFNAFIAAINSDGADEFGDNVDQALDYFTEEYRKALSDNLQDYQQHFDDYLNAREAQKDSE